MAVDLSTTFQECLLLAERQTKKCERKTFKINSNNTITDFKIRTVKLLESIFSLRGLLEALHDEYISLTSQNDESVERCLQMEINSSDMMKLCKVLIS